VRGLEKDVPGLKNDAHTAMPEPSFQLVAPVQDGLAHDRLRRRVTVVRAMVDVIGKAATANWAFFHLSAQKSLWQPFSHRRKLSKIKRQRA
jgi:hypothetical protein